MTEKNEALYEIYKNRVVDNRNVSMEFAINHLLSQNKVDRFDLAVGYFYISGLLLIKDTFTEFMEVRDGHMSILMGNETNELTKNTVQAGFYISELNDDELKNDYKNQFQDEIRYLNEEDQLYLMKFIDWLEQKRIEVKVYTGEANYFHAKSYMFYGKENDYSGESLVGSSNFSRNSLQGNTELNVYSADSFNALHEWFKSIWFSDEVDVFSDELIKTIKQVYPDIQQSKRYKSVSETYYDFANMFARPYAQLDDDKIWEALYPHQREGILKIQNKLMQFGTATLADGVGLGKTRTTAGVIRLEKKLILI
ncbi:phospholipase D-like domain-containing protein [Enterococcus faecalis]